MKPLAFLLLLFVGLTTTTASAQGSGTLNFCNRMPTAEPAVEAPVFGPDGTTRLGDSNYLAQLYVGSLPTALAPQGQPVLFGSGALAGYVFGGGVLTDLPPGDAVFVQMRAWCQLDGATYEAAQAALGRYGASGTIQVRLGGDNLFPPVPPADLVGLRTFTLTNGAAKPPYLAACQVLGAGVVEITATNLSGFAWTALASPDLARPVVNWDVLGPLTPLGANRYVFIDPAYSSARQRFYRLRWP